MNLVSFSIRTKGLRNFLRRLWTVFARFGVSEARTRRNLYSIMSALHPYGAAPSFYIPAVVLRRHPALITEIARDGGEIGIHGYVHNDYRFLSRDEQRQQVERAVSLFEWAKISFHGFRNPYLGWTQDSLQVFTALGLTYDSNEAVFHDVIDLDAFPAPLRESYAKSLELFQAIPCSAYTLRPHFEGNLIRVPTSIPDDEMLFDRLRLTNTQDIGNIWCSVMQRVYDLGGLYTLNLHPERGRLCGPALELLLSYAQQRPHPVWLARVNDIAQWWQERQQFRLRVTPVAQGRWQVQATCSPRAALLARSLTVESQQTLPWSTNEVWVPDHCCIVNTPVCPCIGLSPQTSQDVADLLQEEGYPIVRDAQQSAHMYACYLDLPEELGATPEERRKRCTSLVQQIEEMEAPFLRFACWPDGCQAALAITGDIDSITVQDFFARIMEVR
jgi:peptidoglycan/xylan/chitin deacetylase (PgdA/CDA1 family)